LHARTGEAICAAHQLLALRLHGGLDFHEIGCITPYHQQTKEIRKRLGPNREFDRMDISSVDAFQGQQREAIVMSFVRSNRSNAIGFLSDLRRMNVSFFFSLAD
jgi:superfamily I DNA and/or RNA helicase